MRAAKRDLDDAALTIQRLRAQLERATVELAEKTAALRATDPVDVQRRVDRALHDGRSEAAVTREAELAKLRGEVAQQRSEIDDLRASKKKLREALERAKEDR